MWLFALLRVQSRILFLHYSPVKKNFPILPLSKRELIKFSIATEEEMIIFERFNHVWWWGASGEWATNNNLFEADKEGRRGALDTWSWEFRGTIVIHSMLCDLCRLRFSLLRWPLTTIKNCNFLPEMPFIDFSLPHGWNTVLMVGPTFGVVGKGGPVSCCHLFD